MYRFLVVEMNDIWPRIRVGNSRADAGSIEALRSTFPWSTRSMCSQEGDVRRFSEFFAPLIMALSMHWACHSIDRIHFIPHGCSFLISQRFACIPDPRTLTGTASGVRKRKRHDRENHTNPAKATKDRTPLRFSPSPNENTLCSLRATHADRADTR